MKFRRLFVATALTAFLAAALPAIAAPRHVDDRVAKTTIVKIIKTLTSLFGISAFNDIPTIPKP